MDDEQSQKHEDQLTEPLLQITNCSSSSKADSTVAVINSESDGVRTFFPSVMENWVRNYKGNTGDLCLKKPCTSLSAYFERKSFCVTSDFMVHAYNAGVIVNTDAK